MNIRDAFIARKSDELYRDLLEAFEKSESKINAYVGEAFGEGDETFECMEEAHALRAEIFARATGMLKEDGCI